MPLTNEERLLSAVRETGDLTPLLDRGVDDSWFYNPDLARICKWLLDYHARYGVVPTKATWRSEYPAFDVPVVTEAPEYLVDKQAEYCRAMEVTATIQAAADLVAGDEYDDALAQLAAGLVRSARFSPIPSRMTKFFGSPSTDERDDYDLLAAGGGMVGFGTGFPTIDAATLGLQPGQLITVLAQPKVGKTTLSLVIADHVYVSHAVPVLFASFEMGAREMRARQRSLMAHVDFKALQAGRLTPLEEKRYFDHLDLIDAEYTWPFWFMDAATGSTVSAIESQINRLSPRLVVVDGIYMMTDEISGEVNSAQALTNITRSLKRLAARTGLPILINTQALAWKSKGPKITMDSAGYSSSFAQDSDVILGLERPPEPGGGVTYDRIRVLKVLASRNTGLAEVDLTFDFETGVVQEDT